MSDFTILGYRVPFGRETVAKASQIEQQYRRSGMDAHAIAVTKDGIECWVEDEVTEPLEFKGAEFTGLVSLEQSQAHRAARGERAMARNAWARRGSLRGGLDPAAMHIDDWWSNTAGVP